MNLSKWQIGISQNRESRHATDPKDEAAHPAGMKSKVIQVKRNSQRQKGQRQEDVSILAGDGKERRAS
jgi:hypothetical protein